MVRLTIKDVTHKECFRLFCIEQKDGVIYSQCCTVNGRKQQYIQRVKTMQLGFEICIKAPGVPMTAIKSTYIFFLLAPYVELSETVLGNGVLKNAKLYKI